MAKKRIEQENDQNDGPITDLPDDEQPIGYENVEPEAVEEEQAAALEMPFTGGDYGEQGPIQLDIAAVQPDERTYRVSFALPYGVLVALIDPSHPEADVERAAELGLL